MVEGRVHVYVHLKIYTSVFYVYIGEKNILKGSLAEGGNAQCSVKHHAKVIDTFVRKYCLKAAFSIQHSIECCRNPHIRFILRVHHSL